MFLNGCGFAVLTRGRNKNKCLLQEEKKYYDSQYQQKYMNFTDLLARAHVQLLFHVRVAITCNLELRWGGPTNGIPITKFANLVIHLYNAK